MHRQLALFIGTLLVWTACASAQVATPQPRWAALAPNNEATAPVAWGATEEEASAKAAAACRRMSNTCASRPAVTDDMTHVFVMMCCTQPRLGCAVGFGNGARDARQATQKMFSDAGFSTCTARQFLSAGTGKPVAGD